MTQSKIELEKVTDTRKILLVGRSGNGKTSVIESIKRATNNESTVFAVECPGVGDNDEDREEDIDAVINKVDIAIKDCSTHGSVRAIVYVMKYGVRFTEQEQDSVENVRKMFGRDALRQFGIIVLTNGDLFDADCRKTGHTFGEWCAEQQGEIKLLFEEVDNRVVLFNNKTNDTELLNKQFSSLYRCVDEIDKDYTTSMFNVAFIDRRSLLSGENVTIIPLHVDLFHENQRMVGSRGHFNIFIASNIITGIFYLLFAISIFLFFLNRMMLVNSN